MIRDTKTTRQDDKRKIERCIRGDGLSLSERIIREGSWRKQRSSCKLNEKERGRPDGGPAGFGLYSGDVRSHWNISNRGMACSELHLQKITTAVTGRIE